MSELSPRTDAEPMAFSRSEFWRGACGALVWYLVGVAAVGLYWVLIAGAAGVMILLYTVMVAGVTAALSFLLSAPLAWLLGQRLRRVASTSVHLLGFTCLGAIVGIVTVGAFWWLAGPDTWILPALWPYAAVAVVAVPWAWWRTSARALRADRLRMDTARTS